MSSPPQYQRLQTSETDTLEQRLSYGAIAIPEGRGRPNHEDAEDAPALVKDGKIVPKEADPYAAPDGGWGWVVMISCFVCCLVLDGIAYVFGVFLQPLIDHYGVDNAEMATVGSVLSGTIQLVGPFVALMVNLVGTRVTCISGAVISALGFFASAYAPDVFSLIVIFGVIAGAGLGLMYVPAIVAVGMYFDKRRAMATGFVCSGSGAGTFLLAPLAQLLIDSIGWQGAIKVFAGMCLACAICGLTMKPLPKRPSPDNEEDMNCVKKIVVGSCNPRLMTNVPFMLLALSNLFATQGLYIPYMFIKNFALEMGVTSVNASLLISIIGITNTLARILTGLITDLPFINPLIVTTLALGIGGVAPLAISFCDAFWSFALCCTIFGISLAAWVAVTSPAIVKMCGVDLLTSGFGTLTFVRGFAALVGPPIGGYLVDQTGDMRSAFYLSAALLFTSAVICFMSWVAEIIIDKRRSNSDGAHA